MTKTKGQVEDQIGKAIVKFFIKYYGSGPKEVKTHIVDDVVVVRILDNLRPFEKALAATGKEVDISIVKDVYRKIREHYIEELMDIVRSYTHKQVTCSHHDISTRTGERIEVFILDDSFPQKNP